MQLRDLNTIEHMTSAILERYKSSTYLRAGHNLSGWSLMCATLPLMDGLRSISFKLSDSSFEGMKIAHEFDPLDACLDSRHSEREVIEPLAQDAKAMRPNAKFYVQVSWKQRPGEDWSGRLFEVRRKLEQCCQEMYEILNE
jgi:hypothetical protein